MDLVEASNAVALMLATGGIQGLGQDAARSAVARLRDRVRSAFHGDLRAVAALEQAMAQPDGEWVRELAAALARRAGENEDFANDLYEWAEMRQPTQLIQNVQSGGDSYVAGRDMTVNREN
jgi:hypothetical protein